MTGRRCHWLDRGMNAETAVSKRLLGVSAKSNLRMEKEPAKVHGQTLVSKHSKKEGCRRHRCKSSAVQNYDCQPPIHSDRDAKRGIKPVPLGSKIILGGDASCRANGIGGMCVRDVVRGANFLTGERYALSAYMLHVTACRHSLPSQPA